MLIPKKITGFKKSLWAIVLLIVVLGIIYVIYDHYFADTIRSKRLDKYVSGRTEVFKVPEINADINVDLLNTSKYINLKQFGVLPVTYQRKGKSDPFRPLASAPSVIEAPDAESVITSP